MCQLTYSFYRLPRRPVDIVKCHCFTNFSGRENVTVNEYIDEVACIYKGAHLGFLSIAKSLIGKDFEHKKQETIKAWDLQDGAPILSAEAEYMSYWPYKKIREKCIDAWEKSANEDKAPYTCLSELRVCQICGGQFSTRIKNSKRGYGNYGSGDCCIRKSCRSLVKATRLAGSPCNFNTHKKPLTLKLLQEAIKNGGNNEVFRWLEKNAFRDSRKVCQRRDRRHTGQDSGKGCRLNLEKCCY